MRLSQTSLPVVLAAAAHVWAWAVAALFVYEVAVVAGEPGNVIALAAITTPVLLSGLTLFCTRSFSGRTPAWVLAWIALVPCLVGFATFGMFMLPAVGLMFWAANEIPETFV